MKTHFLIVIGSFFFFQSIVFAMGCRSSLPDPEVVKQVDLNRYVGKWFEVAHSPNFFQRNCVSSTAQYQATGSDEVSVLNTCFKADGTTSSISGKAFVVDSSIPAKLKVRFSFFQRGDYWITELDPNYQWAVVSGPGKKFNFILSRVAPMPTEQLKQVLEVLKAKGFDTESFIFDQY